MLDDIKHITDDNKMAKNTESKPKYKENLNQQSTSRTDHVCAYHCAQLLHTIYSTEHFCIVIAQMSSTGGEGIVAYETAFLILTKIIIQYKICAD